MASQMASRIRLTCLVLACALSIQHWHVNASVLPGEEEMQGIWEGTRTTQGFMIGAGESWQAGCVVDNADRLRRNKITVIDTAETDIKYNVTLEIGAFDADLVWQNNVPGQVVGEQYAFLADVTRWPKVLNASISEYGKQTVEFEAFEATIGKGVEGGCQLWSVKKGSTVTLKQYEIVEASVLDDGTMSFTVSCPPANVVQEPFCQDTRVTKEQRAESVKKQNKRKVKAVEQKRNNVRNEGLFGYCLDLDDLASAGLGTAQYYEAQLANGGSDLNRCLDYFANGMKTMYLANPGGVQGRLRTCFEIMTAASTFQSAGDAVQCYNLLKEYFETKVGPRKSARQLFCRNFPSCQVCDFCMPYAPTGDDCGSCGGNAPAPPYNPANGWNGYNPYAVPPPARRRLQQQRLYSVKLGVLTELTCMEGPCKFMETAESTTSEDIAPEGAPSGSGVTAPAAAPGSAADADAMMAEETRASELEEDLPETGEEELLETTAGYGEESLETGEGRIDAAEEEEPAEKERPPPMAPVANPQDLLNSLPYGFALP